MSDPVPPGWYPDPEEPATRSRWWDGGAWTEHTAESAPGGGSGPGQGGRGSRPVLLVLAVVLLVGVSLAAGWFLGGDRASSPAEVAAPSPAADSGRPSPSVSDSPKADRQPSATTAEDVATPEPAPDATANRGPGWIVVVESLEDGAYSRSDAERIADRYRDRGLSADVLHSDEFPSLNPGYWVVHAGGWWDVDDEDAAAAYCRSIRPEVANCYQRYAGA